MAVYPKHYLDIDVLTAARQRMDRILAEFDDAVVSFSGGKDSLVCLHLLRDAYRRHGRSDKVKVAFYDEELIPAAVVDFVDEYRRKDWIDLAWYCYPMESNKFVLGKVDRYVQWDPDRPHVREMPPWALRPPKGKRGPFSQYNMLREVVRRCRGRVANITGIRCDESLNRYCSVAQKEHNAWQSKSGCPTATQCKPIYDWTENDVFKYLGELGVRYCGLYDAQLYDRTPFRVSTPIHTGSAKRLDAWRRLDPDFHRRVTQVFPEMLVQERYYAELDRRYENTLEAVEEWIDANVADAHRASAVETLVQLRYAFGRGKLDPDSAEDWALIWRRFTSGAWLKGTADIQKPKGKRKA